MNPANKVLSYRAAISTINFHRQNNQTIVFKSGCFDVIHIGHIMMLQDAASLGQILVVGIGSNDTVQRQRKTKTVFDEFNRAYVIASLECVDYVVVLREESHGNVDHADFIRQIQPDYFVISSDDNSLDPKKILAKAAGVKFITRDPFKVLNYGELIEPHSSNFKK